jgi:hypothetical protein
MIISKKVFLILCLVVLAVALSASVLSATGRTRTMDQTLTGTYRALDQSHGLFDVTLRGSPGTAVGQGISFSGPPVKKGDLPGDNICVDLPESPDGTILTKQMQANLIYEDGSMLFSNGALGGYLCFVPAFVFAPYEIVGGTGRCEGASGAWQAEITTHPFGGPAGSVIGESGTVSGEIVLP